MNIQFKEFKKYVSIIDRVSICMKETLQYDNYRYMRDVPEKYDDYYLSGVGLIESEFKIDESTLESELKGKDIGNGYYFAKCIEIVLCEVPRDE